MNNELANALQTAADAKQDFGTRVSALDRIASIPEADSISGLHRLLDRSRPAPESVSINFDPIALERVVDLHIVRVLNTLGDQSELGRIVRIVAQATGVLEGMENEFSNAAQVIQAIGRVGPVQDMIQLASFPAGKENSNAVRVLDRLHLPRPAVCNPIPDEPALQRPVAFQFHTLKQELETMEKLSEGHIRLSTGVREFLVTGDYDRGPVSRNASLATILENSLRVIDFEYYTEGGVVVICTFAEAGQRWRSWWLENGNNLVFEGGSFRIAVR